MGTRGCFGHIVTHNPDLPICQSCEDKVSCSKSVSERVIALQSLGRYVELAQTIPERTERVSKSDESRTTALMSGSASTRPIGAMTKKAKEIHDTLNRRDIDLKAGIMGGFNPVAGRPKFLASGFDEVLKGGYSKRKLAVKFIKEFGWTRGTANSHVGICTSLFRALKLVSVDGDAVTTCDL